MNKNDGVSTIKKHPGIDGTCGWAGEHLTILDPTSKSGRVVGTVPCKTGVRKASAGKDMCTLGHTPELVSEVGSMLVGVDATSSGLTLILVTVHSIWIPYVEVGTATSVLYNLYDDNGTKPPLGKGIKSFDEAESTTEESSDILTIAAELSKTGKALCTNDVLGCHTEPRKSSALIGINPVGSKTATDRVYGVIHKAVFSAPCEPGVEAAASLV